MRLLLRPFRAEVHELVTTNAAEEERRETRRVRSEAASERPEGDA
jgi:hypothetical protein